MSAEPRRAISGAVWVSLTVALGGFLILIQACFGPSQAPVTRPPPAVETPRLSSARPLVPFFARIAALDAKQSRLPVRILQIGDSHTANDSFSGRMRERLQARFGGAGRGWLPAGIPFKWYDPRLVEVSESGWRHVKPRDSAGIALGLDAVVVENEPPAAEMAIGSTEPGGFGRFAVEYLTQPGGSAFGVSVDDGAPVRVSTAAATTGIKVFDLPLDHPARRVVLRAAGRPPVALLGWNVERHEPGVIYENHGTIGATVGLIGQMTPEVVSFELAERRPALLIVAFGTNEGFDETLDIGRYETRFRDNVAVLQRAAHDAPVLLLGPPDGNQVDRGCPAAPCGSGDGCVWHEPANLTAVREAQRRVAAQQGWAYWDWFAAMGGTCSIDRMTIANPPLATPDHVHLRTAGYQAMADLLFGELMRDYESWKTQPGPSS